MMIAKFRYWVVVIFLALLLMLTGFLMGIMYTERKLMKEEGKYFIRQIDKEVEMTKMDFFDRAEQLTLTIADLVRSGRAEEAPEFRRKQRLLWAKASNRDLELYVWRISQALEFRSYKEALTKAKAARTFCRQKIKKAGKRMQEPKKRRTFII